MFVKLFGSILNSSVWAEDAATRIVWITLLIRADEDGFVQGVDSSIARDAAVSAEETRRALDILSAPDPNSQTPDNDGRRIERVQGGWQVLNYTKYRELRTREQVKEASKKARQRARKQGSEGDVSPLSPDLSPLSPPYASVSVSEVGSGSCSKDIETGFSLGGFWDIVWREYPKRAGGNSHTAALKAYRARLKDGVREDEMLGGVRRYAAFCRATGKVGTEYVKQAATFFGPSEHWAEPWTVPAGKGEQRANTNHDILNDFLESA